MRLCHVSRIEIRVDSFSVVDVPCLPNIGGKVGNVGKPRYSCDLLLRRAVFYLFVPGSSRYEKQTGQGRGSLTVDGHVIGVGSKAAQNSIRDRGCEPSAKHTL